MKFIVYIVAFLFNIIYSYGQHTYSLKIAAQSAFNYDRCNNEDGKVRMPADTTLTHADSTRCYTGYVMATNRSGVFYITEFDLTGNYMAKGFVIAIKYPRNFIGLNLKPKTCCYRKTGTWKIFSDYDSMHNNYNLTQEINFTNDGPVLLDNLPVNYCDLHEFYDETTAKIITSD